MTDCRPLRVQQPMMGFIKVSAYLRRLPERHGMLRKIKRYKIGSFLKCQCFKPFNDRGRCRIGKACTVLTYRERGAVFASVVGAILLVCRYCLGIGLPFTAAIHRAAGYCRQNQHITGQYESQYFHGDEDIKFSGFKKRRLHSRRNNILDGALF